MSKPSSGLFSGTKGDKAEKEMLSTPKDPTPLFSNTGHISTKSVSKHREFFYNKSVSQIEQELNKQGYITKKRPSTHATSKAEIIIVTNADKHRNITQVQVSPGSKRHGDVPYVKISTNNTGRIKVINATKEEYKSDGKEKAKIFFKRRKK